MSIEDESFARPRVVAVAAAYTATVVDCQEVPSHGSCVGLALCFGQVDLARGSVGDQEHAVDVNGCLREATRRRAVLFANDAASGVGGVGLVGGARDFRRKLVRNIGAALHR